MRESCLVYCYSGIQSLFEVVLLYTFYTAYDPKNEIILAPQVNDTILTDVSPLKNPSEYLPRLKVLKL